MKDSKRKTEHRWLFGLPLAVGLLLTASDGYFFPLANLAGIVFIIIVSLLCRNSAE